MVVAAVIMVATVTIASAAMRARSSNRSQALADAGS
jgi:hypothetical protein